MNDRTIPTAITPAPVGPRSDDEALLADGYPADADVVMDGDGKVYPREQSESYMLEGPIWATRFSPEDGSVFIWSTVLDPIALRLPEPAEHSECRPVQVEIARADEVTTGMTSPGRFAGLIRHGAVVIAVDVTGGATIELEVNDAEALAQLMLAAVSIARGAPLPPPVAHRPPPWPADGPVVAR